MESPPAVSTKRQSPAHCSVYVFSTDSSLKARIQNGFPDNERPRFVWSENEPENIPEPHADVFLIDAASGTSGLDLCRRIRSDKSHGTLPILILIPDGDDACENDYASVGADDFISAGAPDTRIHSRLRTVCRLSQLNRSATSARQFELVAERSEAGIVSIQPDGKLAYTNAKARLYLDLHDESPLTEATELLKNVQARHHCEPEAVWARWSAAPASGPDQPCFIVTPESSTTQAFWLRIERLAEDDEPLKPGCLIRILDVSATMVARRQTWEFQNLLSHKLRTPVNGLMGSMQFLTDAVDEFSPEEIAEFAQISLQSIQRLSDQINDILSYIDASKSREISDSFPLKILEKTVDDIAEKLGLNHLAIRIDPALDDRCFHLSDSGIRLILRELFENAVKFHPQRAPVVEISVTPVDGQRAALRILDDGINLTAEQIANAWTPFFQGEKYFTGETRGMGLGLPTVGTLIWNQGGTYRLGNRDGQPGVCVELVLPIFAMDESD